MRARENAKGGAGIALAPISLIRIVFAAFALSLVTTLFSTPLARRAALRLGLVDHPSPRKVHAGAIPYLGGLAIIAGFCAGLSLILLAHGLAATPEVVVLVGGALTLALMGLWDDWKVVPGWIKVPVELSLGALLYLSGARVELFGFWPLDFVVTVAWVIGVANAINYIDNMDGLSAGVVAIAGSFFVLVAGAAGQSLIAGLSAALAGSALGFLPYNRAPARIFMGDTGSLFFGFSLAGLGLELRLDNLGGASFLVPVAIMAVPVADALLVSVSRTMRGLSPIHPGKDHISHRLKASGFSSSSAVRLLWLATAVSGGFGLLLAQVEALAAYVLTSGLVAVCLLLGLVLLRIRVDE